MSDPPGLQDTVQRDVRRKFPKCIRYVPIPGEWQRQLHPHWPESVFRIPDQIPDGYIYYVTKGDYVRHGSTALVERLSSGHITKTPMPNPYDPVTERLTRQDMEREYEVYCLIGSNPYVPKVIQWDGDSRTLTLEDHANGDLETYLREHDDIPEETRGQWTLQAARALESLHMVGVIHQDITPRKFLVDQDLNLRICDFAGSSIPGRQSSISAPGARYQSRSWHRGYVPTKEDDIFGLGSVLYFILTGEEPYNTVDEDEVEQPFGTLQFPTCDHLSHGNVIVGCWSGHFTSAGQVAQALTETENSYPKSTE